MYRIIVVDDEKLARDRICRYVEKIPGMKVVADMCNGEEARDYLEYHMVDMVITDIRMPVMDGLELANWIQENCPECHVILISAYEDFEYARQAIQFGVKSYLVKPIRLAEFTELVTKMQAERDERERKELFKQNMELRKSEKSLKDWIQNAKVGVQEAIPYLKGSFYVIEENKDYQGDKGLLQIALNNIFRWTAPRCYPVFINKEGWGYRFIVMYEEENLKPDPEVLEERTKRLLGCTFKACCVGDFSKPEELHCLVGGQVYEEDEVISQVTNYIMSHLKEPIGREDAAGMADMAPNYFSHYFKTKTGMYFKDYVLQMRMEEAKKLLKNGLKVREVCEQTGYNDRDYFNKVFRQYTGMSPSEYKSSPEQIDK